MYVFSIQSGEILNSTCFKKESKRKFTQKGLRFVASLHLVYLSHLQATNGCSEVFKRPREIFLVIMAYTSSKNSDEPAHQRLRYSHIQSWGENEVSDQSLAPLDSRYEWLKKYFIHMRQNIVPCALQRPARQKHATCSYISGSG